MFWKRGHEGYLMRDDRVSGGSLFETAISTCSHCQRGVIRNPARERERAYCPKCDHYICDECEALRVLTGQCVTFKQKMDEFEKELSNG